MVQLTSMKYSWKKEDPKSEPELPASVKPVEVRLEDQLNQQIRLEATPDSGAVINGRFYGVGKAIAGVSVGCRRWALWNTGFGVGDEAEYSCNAKVSVSKSGCNVLLRPDLINWLADFRYDYPRLFWLLVTGSISRRAGSGIY
jgi:hypothetical protein